MQIHITALVVTCLLVAATPGCLVYRWGTPLDGPLPSDVPINELIVLAEDPAVSRACERIGGFARVDDALSPWPASGGSTPHPPDAWIEVRVEAEPADAATRASTIYSAVAIVPFVASLGSACPLVVLSNNRLVVIARGARPDDAWIRGEEIARVEVRFREGQVLWGVLAGMACHAFSDPAPAAVLEGGLRLLAWELVARRRAATEDGTSARRVLCSRERAADGGDHCRAERSGEEHLRPDAAPGRARADGVRQR